MRIIGGAWRGRPLRPVKGTATRPTSDRVREALFDALTARLGSDLGGGAVLDLYAGTGALGLEALSRGASRAVFIESGRDALRVIAANVSTLGAADRCVVIAADVAAPALSRAAGLGPFALLLVDPPYRIDPARVADALQTLEQAGALEPDAMVVYEHAATASPALPERFEKVRTYTYGETAVTLLSRSAD